MVHVVVTLERGMYRARSKARTTRVTSTTKTVNAAFSKSAIRGKYSNARIQNEFPYVLHSCVNIDMACNDLI
jgi:hypothetical protein